MIKYGFSLGTILGLIGYFWLFKSQSKNKKIFKSVLLFILGPVLFAVYVFLATWLVGM